MINNSDYGSRRQKRPMGTVAEVSGEFKVLTTDTATVTVVTCPTFPPAAGSPSTYTGYQVFVQRILVSFTTSAAQTLTFQDTNGTPVVIAKTPSSPSLGVLIFDFGPNGFPITKSANLSMVISGAGLGAIVDVEAYAKLVK